MLELRADSIEICTHISKDKREIVLTFLDTRVCRNALELKSYPPEYIAVVCVRQSHHIYPYYMGRVGAYVQLGVGAFCL